MQMSVLPSGNIQVWAQRTGDLYEICIRFVVVMRSFQSMEMEIDCLHQHHPHKPALRVSKSWRSRENPSQLCSSLGSPSFTAAVGLGVLIWCACSNAEVCALGAATFPNCRGVLEFSLWIITKLQVHFTSYEIKGLYYYFFLLKRGRIAET